MSAIKNRSQLQLTPTNSLPCSGDKLGGILDWFMGLCIIRVDPSIELLALFARYPGFVFYAVNLDNVPEKNWLFLYFARFASHSYHVAPSFE